MTSIKTIIWSGGYDSTALILRAIQRREEFRTLSFQLGNNPDQSRREDQARRDIAQILRAGEGSNFWHSHENIEIPALIKSRNVATIQPVLWTVMAGVAYDGEFEFGYVRGDDVWHHRDRVLTVVEGLMNAIRFNDASVKFSYPFEWETKHDLLCFYDGHEALMPLISTVEEGDYHWLSARCHKGSEMRELWDALLKRRVDRHAEVFSAKIDEVKREYFAKEVTQSPHTGCEERELDRPCY